jgi:hypothetical protein
MWILKGSDDQVHLWWQMLEQKSQGIVNQSGINDVACKSIVAYFRYEALE